jgi:DnaA family protein
MQKPLVQLALGLSLKDEATFDNFYPGKNTEIIAALKKTASGQGERVTYLRGGEGQGCSHLLQACCHYANLHHIRSVYLPFSQVTTLSSELLSGLESVALICLDDLQVIAGNLLWEEAIFHLYNRVFDAGGCLMIGAKVLPKTLHFQLPDLVSRLSGGVTYKLYTLTDKEKLSALMMRASRRGIDLSEEAAKYILTHYPRHMGILFAALDKLDKASLAAQRRLTIPFVKTVLQNEGKNDDTD